LFPAWFDARFPGMTPPPSTKHAPPVAPTEPHEFTRHGVTVHDNYAWLRAANWQEAMRKPETLDLRIRGYLEAENAYTAATMAHTQDLQDRLFAEMKGRIKEDDSGVPSPDGAWAYAHRYVTGSEHPLIVRTPRDGGTEQILLDGDAMSKGLAYWELANNLHSPDHRLLAYAVDDTGSEYCKLRFRDLATGGDLPDKIGSAGSTLVWSPDSKALYYTLLDDNHRSLTLHKHVLGMPAASDTTVYSEADKGLFVGAGQTQSGRFIVVHVRDHTLTELRLIDTEQPQTAPILVAARETGHEYSIEHSGGLLYILTNSGGAEDFRICTAPVDKPTPENWTVLEPHRPGRLILAMTAYKNHLVRLEREDGLPRIVVRRLRDGAEHTIAFAEEAYSLGFMDGFEFDTTSIRFVYSSMTTPTETWDYDMETRERTLRKVQEVPSGHVAADYVSRRVMAPAKDGELVPVSLLYRRGTKLDGTAPLLLYGYGSYGIAMPASFSVTRLSLADRGWIYAIAHIRGGKDKGYHWYTDGKLDKKINSFTDFIAAGEYLSEQKFTSRGKIVAHGGSAGGLLMGAVANMAPDLWRGIVAEVPFVDVVNTILDDTLPLTPPEWKEWGNPITDEAAFRYMLSYSPYDNVEAKAYPAILAMGGLTDPRVTYWEPAKWVAKLRAKKTDRNLLLLKINMEAGHGGASGRFERLKETALAYAFAVMVAGPNN
jgi:oligopeptidase B